MWNLLYALYVREETKKVVYAYAKDNFVVKSVGLFTNSRGVIKLARKLRAL